MGVNILKKKFLFVLPAAKLSGGAQRVMFNLARHLVLNDQDVTLITMTRGFEKGWDVLNDHSNFNWIIGEYKSEKSSLIPITLQILKLDRKYKFDYIFSSHIHINSYLSTLKKLGVFSGSFLTSRESTMVFERNTDYKKYFFKFVYKYLYGSQDLLICQTESMKKSLLSNLGFNPVKNTVVIPNPVSVDFINSSISSSINAELAKDKFIVACGRLVKLKQFDLLIKAFESVYLQYSDYKLLIIGEGDERNNLAELVAKLNLKDSVYLVGKVDNPFIYFKYAQIGIVSSKVEGFPNVLLEMMASGTKNIISTPCTDGIKSIPNITISEDCSQESISKLLSQALKSNENYSEQYKNTVIQKHSVDAFWDKIDKISSNKVDNKY